jgi:hypothetical protein
LLCWFNAVPTPVLALEVQRGGMPGQPGAYRVRDSLMRNCVLSSYSSARFEMFSAH